MRKAIIDHYLELMERLNLDGLNLDFEGDVIMPETKEAFVTFCDEATQAINAVGGLFTVDIQTNFLEEQCR